MADDKKQKALEAGRILNSAVFGEALDRMDERCVTRWRAAKTADEREQCWHAQRAIAALRKELFDRLQDAAVDAGGKDKELNAALTEAKKKR